MTKSSLSIWHYVVNIKSIVKILSIFLAFLENTNFTKSKLKRKIIESLPSGQDVSGYGRVQISFWLGPGQRHWPRCESCYHWSSRRIRNICKEQKKKTCMTSLTRNIEVSTFSSFVARTWCWGHTVKAEHFCISFK